MAGSHVRRKHKHKRKKNYVWTGTTQAQEEGKRFFFLRLCLLHAGSHVRFLCACAYACAYAYACVVRVNQP